VLSVLRIRIIYFELDSAERCSIVQNACVAGQARTGQQGQTIKVACYPYNGTERIEFDGHLYFNVWLSRQGQGSRAKLSRLSATHFMALNTLSLTAISILICGWAGKGRAAEPNKLRLPATLIPGTKALRFLGRVNMTISVFMGG